LADVLHLVSWLRWRGRGRLVRPLVLGFFFDPFVIQLPLVCACDTRRLAGRAVAAEVSRLSAVVTDWGVAVLRLSLARVCLGRSGLSGTILLVHRLIVLVRGASRASSSTDVHWYWHIVEATQGVGRVISPWGRASLLLLLSPVLPLLEVLPWRPLRGGPPLLLLLC
jgi:hypothetical protein